MKGGKHDFFFFIVSIKVGKKKVIKFHVVGGLLLSRG